MQPTMAANGAWPLGCLFDLRQQIAMDGLARGEPLVAGLEPRQRVVRRGRFLTIRR